MVFWIATGNKGKAKEFALLLDQPGRKIYFLSNLKPGYKAPKETGTSFKENALIKARSLKQYLLDPKHAHCLSLKKPPIKKPPTNKPSTKSLNPRPIWVLAEDSGLQVKALNGQPGVLSARYFSPHATDKQNINWLLHNLKETDKQNRGASFVACIVALPLNLKASSLKTSSLDTKEYTVEGRIQGHIAQKCLSDTGGFGYDPVFIPKGETKSLAQLGVGYKNKHSHRALAIQKLLILLRGIKG